MPAASRFRDYLGSIKYPKGSRKRRKSSFTLTAGSHDAGRLVEIQVLSGIEEPVVGPLPERKGTATACRSSGSRVDATECACWPTAASLFDFVRLFAGGIGTSLIETGWNDRTILHQAQLPERTSADNRVHAERSRTFTRRSAAARKR